MTEKVFPPGSPQPPASVSKVFRATSAMEGISYLRILPAVVERLDHCWVREGTPDSGQTWAEVNTHALRDISDTDDRPAEDKPPLSLAEAAELMGDALHVDPQGLGEEIEDAVRNLKRAAGPDVVISVTDFSMVERGFSLAASDPGAYAFRRSWPSEHGIGRDYEPVSAWVAHACAHAAASLLPRLLASKRHIGVPVPQVATVTGQQLETAAVSLHRDGCYTGCDVHTLTPFREQALRVFGDCGLLVVDIERGRVSPERLAEHLHRVAQVTGVPIEKLGQLP